MSQMISIESQIAKHAEETPDKIAVISGKKRLTYRELWDNIMHAASIFSQQLHMQPKERVILAADKQVEFLYAYFGGHMAGLEIAPISFNTEKKRLEFIQQKLSTKVLIGFRAIDLPNIQQYDWSLFADADVAMDEENPAAFPEMDSISDILFTTGTTGEPKGVPLTFSNLSAAARNINAFIQNHEDDLEVLALPISHSFGLGRIRCCLSKGATIGLLGNFANVKKLFRTLRDEKATGFSMVPASWRYLKKYTGTRLSEFADQLHFIEFGSAYMSAEEKQELAELFPHTRICMHYGLTEASRSAFTEFHQDNGYLDSVGKPSPHVEIAIFDETGRKLPPMEDGEICVQGEHVTHGYLYYDNSKAFYGDYFRTGDWGHVSSDGYVYLAGRKKELINVGGEKVSPIEIETVLKEIPGVADCACIGVPDPNGMLGEVVKAFIVPDKEHPISFDEIRKQTIGKLEGYKIPAVWDWIDEIPKTQNGKIQRLSLK